MVHVVFTDIEEYLDELLVLRNKRLARNIKEAMIVRCSIKTDSVGDGTFISYPLCQTIVEWDGIPMIFEYQDAKTPSYAEGQGGAELEKIKTRLEEIRELVKKEGELGKGYYEG